MASNLDAGVGQHATVTNPTGKAGSVTQNPLIPVEDGGSSLKSAYTTVTSSDPLVPELGRGTCRNSDNLSVPSLLKEMALRLVLPLPVVLVMVQPLLTLLLSNVASGGTSLPVVQATWSVMFSLSLVTLALHSLSQPLVNYGYYYSFLCR